MYDSVNEAKQETGVKVENKLNIERFFNGLAKALTVRFEKQYPGIVVTVKEIRKKEEDDDADSNLQRQRAIAEHAR